MDNFTVQLLSVLALLGIAYLWGKRQGRLAAEDRAVLQTEQAPPAVNEGVDTSKAVQCRLCIEYRDAYGSLTKRNIRVLGFENDPYWGKVKAFCELREAERSFRFDRIKGCYNLESGEVISDLWKYLMGLYLRSAAAKVEQLLADQRDFWEILYYVAKADGQMQREERFELWRYAEKLFPNMKISPQLIEVITKRLDVLSDRYFELAVQRYAKEHPENYGALLLCATDIINTQNKIHPKERQALDLIQRHAPVFA